MRHFSPLRLVFTACRYKDSLTAYFNSYLWPLGFTISIAMFVGWNIGHAAGETVSYIAGFAFCGIQLIFALWFSILTAARAGNCANNVSVYCTNEDTELIWFAVTGFCLLLVVTLEIVCLAMLFGRRPSYQSTHHKMSSAGSKMPNTKASQPITMFQPQQPKH